MGTEPEAINLSPFLVKIFLLLISTKREPLEIGWLQ